MIARLKKIINNEISRSKWIEKSLKILPHGKILDLGCGSQQYRKFCDHLIYRGQDFGCQGAVKVCQPSAVESVPLLNVRAVKFSFDREGEFSDVKQDRYVE